MATRGVWPNGRNPWDIWSQRARPRVTPMVAVPVVETQGDKSALRLQGVVPAEVLAEDGAYLGPDGLVEDFDEAANIHGAGGREGDPGGNGVNGWTPVLTPEQDGTRTLLKVADWMNGGGAKPSSGMYLSAGGYTSDKAKAFNFNPALRIETHSAETASNGRATIVFRQTFTKAPRVFATARGATTSRPMVAEVVSVSLAEAVIQVSRSRASLVSLGSALFDILTGAQVDVIVVEQ